MVVGNRDPWRAFGVELAGECARSPHLNGAAPSATGLEDERLILERGPRLNDVWLPLCIREGFGLFFRPFAVYTAGTTMHRPEIRGHFSGAAFGENSAVVFTIIRIAGIVFFQPLPKSVQGYIDSIQLLCCRFDSPVIDIDPNIAPEFLGGLRVSEF